MLFTSFFSGVRDLVVTPSRAFMRSPTNASGVGIGVAKGTLSLFSHTASGFFGSWAKVSAGSGQLLTWAVLDPEYSTWHRDKIVTEATNLNREWKRRGVQSVRAMLTRPIWDLVFGAASGVGGIIISPIRGYRRGGRIGFLQGVAGGVIGIVVKPVVGVFDASAHFAASVHDIAKSVNVLDKRRQPALKLRLPYTFGLMNILLPFDETAARAVHLLKRFPLKRSQMLSLKQPECLVHVEVLPNVTDTYMIATSARIILIRLRKEPSGSLTPSLCWEVAMTGEALVSSIVSEHGHNGVALTLTVASRGGGGIASHTDSPQADVPDIAVEKPFEDDPGHSYDGEELTSEGPEDLTRFGSDALGDQYHGTGRGEQGELLEWFTIVAEYQYRPQLVRMHNAVSCLAGDFKAVIFDPSLGRPGSTEGYTSFGTFNFSPDESQDTNEKDRDTDIVALLERLPWLHKSTFEALRDAPIDERQEKLAKLLESWSFKDELEVSRKEGGPDWIVNARAHALYNTRDDADPSFTGHSKNPQVDAEEETLGGSRPKKKRWGLPTIPDGGVFEAALRFRPRFNKTASMEQVTGEYMGAGVNNTEIGRESEGDTAKLETNRSKGLGTKQSKFSTPEQRTQASSTRDSSATMSSYRTALESMRVSGHDDWGSNSFTMNNDANDGVFDFAQAASKDTATPPSSSRRASEEEVRKLNWSVKDEEDLTAESDHVAKHPRVLRSYDRLDRMEALMERLLIVSSEKFIEDYNAQRGADDMLQMRQEIAQLREQVQHGTRQTFEPAEMTELRNEIASLKRHLLTTTATARLPRKRVAFETNQDQLLLESPPQESVEGAIDGSLLEAESVQRSSENNKYESNLLQRDADDSCLRTERGNEDESIFSGLGPGQSKSLPALEHQPTSQNGSFYRSGTPVVLGEQRAESSFSNESEFYTSCAIEMEDESSTEETID